eukprot:1073058-Amphidinium_carterae.1
MCCQQTCICPQIRAGCASCRGQYKTRNKSALLIVASGTLVSEGVVRLGQDKLEHHVAPPSGMGCTITVSKWVNASSCKSQRQLIADDVATFVIWMKRD